MPGAMSSSLGFDKLFFGPKHNIYAFFMILFGIFDTIICLSILSFKLWNKKLKIKKNYPQNYPIEAQCWAIKNFVN